MATVSSFLEQTSSPAKDRQRRLGTSHDRIIRVALFCGGRGSASLIRELLRWPEVRLSLLVNAYDDGLSTGHLRDLVPDMLGPSDFRKNLARLLPLHSTEQYALQRLLNHRFPKHFSQVDIEAFEQFVITGQGWLPEPLGALFSDLRPPLRSLITGYLRRFFEYRTLSGSVFNYAESSLGNLILAGVYLDTDHDFNASIQKITAISRSRAELINVSCGENRTLMALKSDGSLLSRESEIVGPQSSAPMVEFFLVHHSVADELKRELAGMSIEEKSRRLKASHRDVGLSPEADCALRQANLIIYGPGTQYSSLLPSYRTRGIAESIAGSRAAVKVFVTNLDSDHDIPGASASDLVDKTLEMLGAPNNGNMLTHILYNNSSDSRSGGIQRGRLAGPYYKGAAVVNDKFESSAQPGVHGGYRVISKAMSLLACGGHSGHLEAVDVYVDLLDRSSALESVVQEFLDLPWDEQFAQVTLRLNRVRGPSPKFPAYANIVSTDYNGSFTDVNALLNWLAHGDTEYLVTLTGDGEYRLSDVLLGIQILRSSTFGVIYGSRTQSRRQFHAALDSAYGEYEWLRFLSWCGAFLYTAIIGVLCQLIFSDPFTGFHIYRRSKLPESLVVAMMRRAPSSAGAVTRMLIRHGIEIAEIPVVYRTFRGFTRAKWRVLRGLKNLLGALR